MNFLAYPVVTIQVFSFFSCILYLLITHPHLRRLPAGFCPHPLSRHLTTKPVLIRDISDHLIAKPNGDFQFLSHWITFVAFGILFIEIFHSLGFHDTTHSWVSRHF